MCCKLLHFASRNFVFIFKLSLLFDCRLGRRWGILLKLIVNKKINKLWAELIWLRAGTMTDSFEHDKESLGSIDGGEDIFMA
jgi:hypothetical protein